MAHHLSLAQRMQASAARYRQHRKSFERSLIRKSSVVLTAGAYGAMARMAIKDDLHGFPWKAGVWLGATVVESLARNPTVQAFASGVSDATLAVYVEKSIANKTLIAGGELAA